MSQTKIKHKIWADQYIDLGTLISPTTLDTTKYSLLNDLDHGPGKLSLEPVYKPKRIGSINQWFVAVYTVTFPASAPALMKYGEIVRP